MADGKGNDWGRRGKGKSKVQSPKSRVQSPKSKVQSPKSEKGDENVEYTPWRWGRGWSSLQNNSRDGPGKEKTYDEENGIAVIGNDRAGERSDGLPHGAWRW